MRKLRGFVSIALVLALALLLIQVSKSRIDANEKASFYERNSLLFEKKYYVDQDVKNAFRQVLANAVGSSADEKTSYAAEKLVELEDFSERYYLEKGVALDFWVGGITQEEIDSINVQMLDEKKVLKCGTCFDLDSQSLDLQEKPVLNSRALLSVDDDNGNVVVSRNGLVYAPFLSMRLLNGRIGFGVSYYFPEEKIAAIALIPEGFS